MILEFADWVFNVDTDATREFYFEEFENRCECNFCKNFFATVDMFYPDLRHFLGKFHIDPGVPEALLPFRPTLYQASYYAIGKILRYGSIPIQINGVPITAENGEPQNTILLHIGLMELPWIIDQDPSGTRSPASMGDFFTSVSDEMSHTLS